MVGLSLESDGEIDELTWLKRSNAPTEVRLERVQIQSIDGSVENLGQKDDKESLPFSIAVPGREGQTSLSLRAIG